MSVVTADNFVANMDQIPNRTFYDRRAEHFFAVPDLLMQRLLQAHFKTCRSIFPLLFSPVFTSHWDKEHLRPSKCAAKYLYLCLTYFLIDSFKNESFQRSLPFQRKIKEKVQKMHNYCSLECLPLRVCMKGCQLRVLFIDNLNPSMLISIGAYTKTQGCS